MPHVHLSLHLALSISILLTVASNCFGDLVLYAESGFGDSISSFNNVNDGSTTLATHPAGDPATVAVDHLNQRVFYSYGTSVAVVDFNGENQLNLLDIGTGISAMTYDATNGYVYFATTSGSLSERAIYRVGTDGTGLTTIHSHDSLLDDPFVTTSEVHNLVVDSANDRLYWTADDGGVAGRIGLNFSTLSGSGVDQLWRAAGRSDAISKMEIDLEEGQLYYTVGSTTDELRRSNLDNSSIETLVSGIGEPYALDIDTANDNLFFVIGGTLYEGRLDGTELESTMLSSSSLFNVRDLEVSATAIPEPSSLALLTAAIWFSVVLLRHRFRECNTR